MKKRDSLIDNLNHITGGVGGLLAEVYLLILLATRGRNTPKLTTKMGKYMQN
jgi:hypothetical protein